jgi:hypothetical protein
MPNARKSSGEMMKNYGGSMSQMQQRTPCDRVGNVAKSLPLSEKSL